MASSRSTLRIGLPLLVGFLALALSITGVTTAKADYVSNPSVIATITGFKSPVGVAVHPDGTRAYVTNNDPVSPDGNSVSVINLADNTLVGTPIGVGIRPNGVALNPAGTRAYVTNNAENSVSVIDTATNVVVATIGVGVGPTGVAVSPDGTRAYVTNYGSNSVSVIDTATNVVVAPINLGTGLPAGVAVNPAGTFA